LFFVKRKGAGDSSQVPHYFKPPLQLIRKNDAGAEARHLVINMKMLR
jgi:hypothetical protein